MIGGSLLSVLPKGFFNWPVPMEACVGKALSVVVDDDGIRRKRRRSKSEKDSFPVGDGSRTPTLVSSGRSNQFTRRVSVLSSSSDEEEEDETSSVSTDSSDDCERPLKRFRGNSKIISVNQVPLSVPKKLTKNQKSSEFLSKVPEDVVAHCLSFLGGAEDRFALQTTCKLFRDISNSDSMLSKVEVGGDIDTGKNGIIQDHDTPATAAAALAPFARAGNLGALYMLGVVKCYCYQDLRNGILMLKMASSRGFVRSSYTLGLILRDALPAESSHFMNLAASKGYLPALQELLPAREMKERFGEPNADELRRHLDPVCLNRLLLRDYVDSAELRGLNTSHCWNPLCGKWAYKATNANVAVRMRRPLGAGDALYEAEGGNDPIVNVANVEQPSLPVVGGGHHHPYYHHRHHRRHPAAIVGDRRNTFINTTTTTADRSTSPIPTSSESNGANTVPPSPSPDQSLAWTEGDVRVDRVARMKMCSRCCRAKYCSKLCQVYDWRSSQHKMECQFL